MAYVNNTCGDDTRCVAMRCVDDAMQTIQKSLANVTRFAVMIVICLHCANATHLGGISYTAHEDTAILENLSVAFRYPLGPPPQKSISIELKTLKAFKMLVFIMYEY